LPEAPGWTRSRAEQRNGKKEIRIILVKKLETGKKKRPIERGFCKIRRAHYNITRNSKGQKNLDKGKNPAFPFNGWGYSYV
jgi:hypothetical protein